MATTTQHQAHIHEILGQGAEWHFRESLEIPRDLERCCQVNKALEFTRDVANVSFCVLISSGCSHLAAIEVIPSERNLKVTVYRLKDGFNQLWTVTHQGSEGEFRMAETYISSYDTAKMHGGITDDGQAVLLIHRPEGGTATAYIVNKDGFTQRKPPSDVGSTSYFHAGEVSEDSEYLFYTRSGAPFGKNGEAKVVEIYSIRHLACVRALTFGFGDGRNLRNTQLLPQLRANGNIYLAIDTSYFGDDDTGSSPSLVSSSDGRLHGNFNGVGEYAVGGRSRTFISPDDAHMFHVVQGEAMLHHWDLKKPSLKPLGSVRLPEVEYSQARRWLIHGTETIIKDAIANQIHRVRFSPKCKVITVVTINYSTVVVNVLLTYNLQLVYYETVKDPTWPRFVPVAVGFNDATGLNVLGLSPSASSTTHQGLVRLFGVNCILIPLSQIFEKIKSVEDYFDSTSDRIDALMEAVGNNEATPECRYSWQPGVMDRNDPTALALEMGRSTLTTAEDARRQQEFYDRVFAPANSSVRMNSTPTLRHFFVPHLFSFEYPWAPGQRVSIFGVVMKNEYHIISIGPSPSMQTQCAEVIRALYATDIKTSGELKELIDIYKSGPNFVLRVFTMGDRAGGYSGAPMPIPRWTTISPHFLEEDSWYDTFIIHRAAHVTLPTGWSHTPNMALAGTTNYHAYFEPRTFVVQDVVDYGHRSRPAYVAPKYMLWREYGLRGLRPASQNALFFGGSRYSDTLGHYFHSIYVDKIYDDSNPLFPSAFAMACNADYRSQQTLHVDAFFRRFHHDDTRLLDNSHAISCTLPLACKARPMATLSFMRHIALFKLRINDMGAVEVKNGATKQKQSQYDMNSRWHWLRQVFSILWYLIVNLPVGSQDAEPEPNTSLVTLPLPGFCSFYHKLYKPPPLANRQDDPFWEFVRASYPDPNKSFPRWEEVHLLASVERGGRGPASPFTRLVDAILGMRDRDLQLSFLRVVWLEKLLAWKMQTFGLRIYITRTALPMLILFCVHLTIGVLLTGDYEPAATRHSVIVILLACIEGLVSCYMLSVKIRQLYRIPRLFLRSIFNYVDTTALFLCITTVFLIASNNGPTRPFLGFSTLLIWIATILMLRVYRPIGMLLLLLTETLQGVFSFLVLLTSIILGFAFVPYLLLRNLEVQDAAENPFSNFVLTVSQMLNFIASDYDALEVFHEYSAAVRTLRATYVVIITILFLNILIAILNLKIKRADKNAGNLYHLQIASLQVQTELGTLSASERRRRDWFPEWFSYRLTESEKRAWQEYVEKNPLKWSEENSFNDDKENAPVAPVKPEQREACGDPPSETNQSTDTNPQQAQNDDNDEWIDEDDSAEVHNQLSSNSTHSCKVCTKPGNLCTSCNMVAYCGKKHQKLDWKNHKSACKGKGKAQ